MPYLSVFSPHAGKYGPEITPYLDTFHAVSLFKDVVIFIQTIISFVLSRKIKNEDLNLSAALLNAIPLSNFVHFCTILDTFMQFSYTFIRS